MRRRDFAKQIGRAFLFLLLFVPFALVFFAVMLAATIPAVLLLLFPLELAVVVGWAGGKLLEDDGLVDRCFVSVDKVFDALEWLLARTGLE